MLLFAAASLVLVSCGDDDEEETPVQTGTPISETLADGTIKYNGNSNGIAEDQTATVNWTADNSYLVNGFLFVNPGQTLNIEAGTIIRFQEQATTGDNASALIVSRGATINATGTASAPIIFTAERDTDVNSASDIVGNQRGLWGGIIILGNASQNTVPGEQAIEGIPTSETRGIYGGSDDEDNSGVFQYVSIRHGGSDIGAGNEINGLSMGCVGRGTTIDHVEVAFNTDDGFEWYGGTVNCKYLVATYCGDDSYDYDQGWRGMGQYWFTIQSVGGDNGGSAGEHDGGTEPESGTPFATPIIYNATYLGDPSNDGLVIRDNAGGQYHYSVFQQWDEGCQVENTGTEAAPTGSYARFLDFDATSSSAVGFALRGNRFFAIGDGSLDDLLNVTDSDADTVLRANTDSIQAALVLNAAFDNAVAGAAIFSLTDNNSNWTTTLPGLASELNLSGNFTVLDQTNPDNVSATSFIDAVSYRGAFDPNGTPWTNGWTYLNNVAGI